MTARAIEAAAILTATALPACPVALASPLPPVVTWPLVILTVGVAVGFVVGLSGIGRIDHPDDQEAGS